MSVSAPSTPNVAALKESSAKPSPLRSKEMLKILHLLKWLRGGGGGVIYAYKYSPVFHIFPISFNCKKKMKKRSI